MTSPDTPRRRVPLPSARSRFIAAGLAAGAVVVVAVALAIGPPPPRGPGSSPAAAASFGALQSIPIESGPPPGAGRVARENLHSGTASWQLPLSGHGDAEGYWDNQSVAPGESIALHVRASSPTVSVGVFRLGWYGGTGARLVARWKDLPVASQPEPATDSRTGLIVAHWSTLLRITIPEDWVSGIYLAELYPKTGGTQYTTFIVREATPQAPILWLSPVTTHEAYNNWGGKSLYHDNSTGLVTLGGDTRAVAVSFDRPYSEYRGAGRVLRWEYPFLRWMEGAGYDVGYAADLDLARDPGIVAGRKLIVIVGHPEYWSAGMRNTLEAAIAAGTNVAFFSSNEIYWQVRFDDAGSNPAAVAGSFRTITCYRDANLDPLSASDPARTTVQWAQPPVNDPESRVIGEMYGHMMERPADWIVTAPDSWIYAGTGLTAGEAITNLVGQEYDQFRPQLAPPGANVQIVATSPVEPDLVSQTEADATPGPDEPAAAVQNATIYTAPSGATVFAAGTMQWGWALDPWGNFSYRGVHTPVDPRAKLIAANILGRLGR